MYDVYKENNCLDLFLNYYGNYFGADNLVEQQTSLVAMIKMIIYDNTLQEENHKSFYEFLNNDLKSGNPHKISRYLQPIKVIHDLIQNNFLKSYSGEVYRASYFKPELIAKIKKGEKMFNAALWSSSKKLSEAKKFLKKGRNVLIHAKIIKGNNIDIHLENLSKYPDEEEVLILPFCNFEIKSFSKKVEDNLVYNN